MPLAKIEQLLTQAIGLDPSTIGRAATERAVHKRLAACGTDNLQDYWNRVRGSAAELQSLIEAVVVPESWFFREAAAFESLARFASARYRMLPAGRNLRFLSVPCSTGEEPYSIAVTLLQAGIPATAFRVDAIDVSNRALQKAQQGVYSRNSFRGPQAAGHARYFEQVGANLRIADRVRDLVTFRQGNLLDPTTLPQPAAYDAIFCRNVLIYFDNAAQDRAVALLSRALAVDGALYVGSAETVVVRSRTVATHRAGARKVPGPAPRPRAAATVQVTVKPIAAPLEPQLMSVAPDVTLDEAERLADGSQFTEALDLCKRHLRQHGPSVRGLYLIGLVRDALGDDREAAEYYRKVLYLDPRHEEALVHLALLLEHDGQQDEAERLRARAVRAAGQAAARQVAP
jgi:chemotaxis protein methyltransferase WspC